MPCPYRRRPRPISEGEAPLAAANTQSRKRMRAVQRRLRNLTPFPRGATKLDAVVERIAGATLKNGKTYLSNASATTSAGSVGVPTVNAMYCLPFTMYVIGMLAIMPGMRSSDTTAPVFLSYARTV
jgi:hypothetical protein